MPGHFERNIERLRERSTAHAERIAAADCSAIELRTPRRGVATLAERGVLLGSAYDPLGEAERLAEAASPRGVDLLVAIGAGLGHHVEAFRAQAQCPTLIFEPSAARLRALCSLRDLCALLEPDDVHWAIDAEDLATRFSRLYVAGSQVRAFVHPAVARLDPDGVRDALARIVRAKDAGDLAAATRVKMSAAWAHLSALNTAELLETPRFSRLSGAFRGLPAVLAAAGPSLEKQLPLLARMADRVLVLAIGQSLPALRRAGIAPDLVHVLESQDVGHQIELGGAADREHLVVAPSAHPSLFRIPVRARFVATPASNPFARWLALAAGEEVWLGGGATVAHSAVRLAAALGADPVLLIGQDLAFTDDRVYAAHTAYQMLGLRRDPAGRLLYTRVQQKASLFGEGDAHADERPVDVVMVPGWDGEPVATSKSYASFIDGYAELGRELADRGTRLINCTEGGARIPGLEHRSFAEALASDAPAAPHDAKTRIRAFHDDAPRMDPSGLERALAEARQTLSRIDRELARAGGLQSKARSRETGPNAVGRLQALARCQRRLDRLVRSLPWLDAMIAGELQELAVASQQSHGDRPLLDTALADAKRMRATTSEAVRRGRELLDRLAGGIDEWHRRHAGQPANDAARTAAAGG